MSRIVTAVCMISLLWIPAFSAQAQPGGQKTGAAIADSRAARGWTEFRGPNRSGISAETGLLRSWPEEGPREIWRRELGEGFSGISVSGERFFTLFAVGEDEFMGGFLVADGREIWRLRIGAKFHEINGNGPRSTPTVDGETVYGLGALGHLVAVRAATGEVIWEVDLPQKYAFYGPQIGVEPTPGIHQTPLFGYACSPLVEGELLVVETGSGGGRSYVAFDKRTGETRWTALNKTGISYSSPVPATIHGRRQILALRPGELVSLLPDGQLYWRQPWAVRTISQPIFVPPDKIFVSTIDHEVGAMVVRVRSVDGRVSPKILWQSRIMKNYWSSSVAYQGSIYGFDNATLRCIAADTGELHWAKRGLGKGSLVIADGLLILLSDRGLLALAEASTESYQEKSRVRIFEGERTWTPPALAGGKLFVRGVTEVVCLDLKG